MPFKTSNGMRICAVQTKPIKGDIPRNIAIHKKLIELAVANSADIIIFQSFL